MQTSLNLIVGSTVYLALPDQEDQVFSATLLGYAENQSVMISLPKADNTPILASPGDTFIMRCPGNEHMFAFETKVQQVCEHPFGYLHMSYPQGIQGVMLRRGQRVPVSPSTEPTIRLSMTDGNEHITVAMADISAFGARLTSTQRLGNVNDSFAIDMQIASANQLITLPCTIRYIRSEQQAQTTYHHGVQFNEMSDEAQLFIQRFITDHIQLQREH